MTSPFGMADDLGHFARQNTRLQNTHLKMACNCHSKATNRLPLSHNTLTKVVCAIDILTHALQTDTKDAIDWFMSNCRQANPCRFSAHFQYTFPIYIEVYDSNIERLSSTLLCVYILLLLSCFGCSQYILLLSIIPSSFYHKHTI